MREVIVTDGETQEVWELYRKGEELPAQVPTAQGGPTPVVTPQVWPGTSDDWRD